MKPPSLVRCWLGSAPRGPHAPPKLTRGGTPTRATPASPQRTWPPPDPAAHLGRTAPAGAAPAAAPPARTRPGPAWWPRPAAEPPPARLSPGATAVSSSRPGAPPAPSAAPAPRAPSRSADPAQPAETRVSPARRRHWVVPAAPRRACQGCGRGPAAARPGSGPPHPCGESGVPREPLGRGGWDRDAKWSRCTAPTSPGSHYQQEARRGPHLGPSSPPPAPSHPPAPACLGRGDSWGWLTSGRVRQHPRGL